MFVQLACWDVHFTCILRVYTFATTDHANPWRTDLDPTGSLTLGRAVHGRIGVPPLLVVVGYWRFGAIPRAVPVVWNQYTFYSIGYTTTLVVASIFYSTLSVTSTDER